MDTGLTGKVVLVTGGSSGIGRSTVELLAEHGARVAFTGRDADKGKAVADQLSDTLFVQADVSIESQVEALFNRIDEQFDDIDCLVNNAGIPSLPSPLEETETSHWNEVIGINLTGAFFCMKHALRRMKQKGKGAIVNVSSIGGVQGFANVGAVHRRQARHDGDDEICGIRECLFWYQDKCCAAGIHLDTHGTRGSGKSRRRGCGITAADGQVRRCGRGHRLAAV